MLTAKHGVTVLRKTYVSMAIQEVDFCSLTARNGLHLSRQLLVWMACNGLESLPLFGDYLIRSFASSSALERSFQTFLRMSTPTVYTWNAIISAHTQHSRHEQALVLFARMQMVGFEPDRITFLCILKVCCAIHAFVEGHLIHMIVVEMWCDLDLVVGSALIHMYCSCAALDEAHKVFETLPNPNIISWGSLITGYTHHGNCMQALQLYERLQGQGLEASKSTFLAVLRACGNLGASSEGHMVHDQVIRAGLHTDVAVTSALMDMYGKKGRLEELHKLFRNFSNHDVISWASFMLAFTDHSGQLNAFTLLQEMEENGIIPDQVIFLCTIRACVDMERVQGRMIHDRIIKAQFESDRAIANTLVDMYAKGGSLREAEKTFKDIKRPNLVSTSAMISGYVQEGCAFMACHLFEMIQDKGIQPDKVTLLGVLRACVSLGAVCKGRQIHSNLIKEKFDTELALGNTLVDLYAKCGSLEEAQKVFESLNERDVVSWRTLISGYVQQGSCMLAMVLTEHMQCQGFRPDDGIYTSILAGCSHMGLFKEGCFYFDSMRQQQKMVLSIEHYNCMLDLFGRVGHLRNAKDVLHTIPVTSSFISWSSLLSGCNFHCDVNLGSHCFSELSHLDSLDASSYMLMSSLYSSGQQGHDASEMEIIRRQHRAWKKPGEAWIEVGLQLHEFTVNDFHSQNNHLPLKLNHLSFLLKLHGHLPDLDVLFEDGF